MLQTYLNLSLWDLIYIDYLGLPVELLPPCPQLFPWWQVAGPLEYFACTLDVAPSTNNWEYVIFLPGPPYFKNFVLDLFPCVPHLTLCNPCHPSKFYLHTTKVCYYIRKSKAETSCEVFIDFKYSIALI